MSDKKEFWRDNQMDMVIEDIITIFTKVEGVELVRLTGLTKRSQNYVESISEQAVDAIIRKLKLNNIINYELILHCPFCQETSYIIKDFSTPTIKKLCDTCGQYYDIIKNKTLE